MATVSFIQPAAEQDDRSAVPRPVELTVVVPTFNEGATVAALVERLTACLDGMAYEILFVDDDSPDGTAQQVRAMAASDPRVRCLRRIGRRGLSSACIEGMLASTAPFLAVMDADLQHDETLLPRMLELMRTGRADIVVGSRYADAPEVPDWNPRRQKMSHLSTRLAQRFLLPAPLSDPMSGFFMVRREVLDASVHRLSGIGFKILLDLVASAPQPLRIVEVPYRFRDRHAGESKLDGRALQDFALLLIDKTIGRWIPARFVMFAAVGGLGVLIHLAALIAGMRTLGMEFVAAQALATVIAMTFNFALNNELTYRDRRLRGVGWLTGWLTFSLACAIGAVANVGVAAVLFEEHGLWFVAALGGILIGAVWNYVVTSLYTWDASVHR